MDTYSFNLLSICSGIGGLDLGIRAALPDARTVCYIEIEAYACEVLAARIEEGSLDDAPIWTDLESFDGQPWRGTVDCIAAGFPCPPVSVAGRRKGIEDERWIWPQIAAIIRQVRPGWVFLENVPGLLSANDGTAFGSILADLAAIGFDAEWIMLRAADVGASHRRARIFILANAECVRWPPPGNGTIINPGREPVARCSGLANAIGPGLEIGPEPEFMGQCAAAIGNGLDLFPPGPEDLAAWEGILAEWPALEPAVCRVADGPAARMDRLRALGNAVVPLQAAAAFRILAERIQNLIGSAHPWAGDREQSGEPESS